MAGKAINQYTAFTGNPELVNILVQLKSQSDPNTFEHQKASLADMIKACPDVVMASTYSALPSTGSDGILYIVKDENIIYRWGVELSTPAYVQLTADVITQIIGSGDTTHAPSADAVYDALASEASARESADSNLLSAIQFNTKRIENLEQKSGSEVDVDYPDYSPYGEVPTGKAKNAIVSKLRGVSVAYNQQVVYKNPNSSVWDMTTDADGVVTLTAKISLSGEQSIYVTENFTYISEHKILIFLDKLEITSSKLLASNFSYNFSSPWLTRTAETTIVSRVRNAGCLFRFMQYTSNGFDEGDIIKFKVRATDLTQMLGSSVADYLYSIEQATTGAGVALFKALVSAQDNSYETGRLVSTTYSTVESYSPNILDNTSFVKGRVDAGVIGYASETSSITITETGVDFTVTSAWRGVASGLIRVKPNTTYTLNLTATSSVHAFVSEYTPSGSFIVTNGVNSPFPSTFTTSATTGLIRLSFQLPVVGSVSITNITIKAGNDGTYTPHLLDTLTLPESVTLRGILKVVNNELVVDGDEYDPDTGGIDRKYGTYTFTGNENFVWYPSSGNNPDRFAIALSSLGLDAINDDALLVGYDYVITLYATYDKVFSLVSSFLTIVDSNYDQDTLSNFKQNLAGKTLVYPLATPTPDTPIDPVFDPTIATEGGGTLSTTQTQDPAIVSALEMTYLTL